MQSPLWGFSHFFLDDKTSAPEVFTSCSFTPHFEISLMVSYYGYEIWRHKGLVKKYREGWAGAFGNVDDKKHMAHPLPSAQKWRTHP